MDTPALSLSSRTPWIHLLGGPVIWAAHFLISYAWVEFACQAHLLVLDSTILGIPVLSHVVLALTLVGVAATGYVGWLAYRRWRELRQAPETGPSAVHGKSEATVWQMEGEQFAAFTGVLLCGLFGLVILLTGLPALALRPCL